MCHVFTQEERAIFDQKDDLFDCLCRPNLLHSVHYQSLEGVSSQPGVVGTIALKGEDREKRPVI